jgi:hypothetical protein
MKLDNKLGVALALGVGIGALVGVLTDNLGLWISVGLAIGAGVGNSLLKKRDRNDDAPSSKNN